MFKTGIKEARQHFTEYLSRVEKGEEIIITKRNEPIARISPVKIKSSWGLASRKALRDALYAEGPALNAIMPAKMFSVCYVVYLTLSRRKEGRTHETG